MIGLVDYDLLQSESTTRIVPNLEIMKLATYYRMEENHFCRLLTLDEEELESYERIYFFSETGRKLLVPNHFKRANNIIYGGSAFTNFKYIPFENRVIDYTIPRVMIYKEYLKQKYQEGFKNLVISHALDDSYYRMYADERCLPIPPIKRGKRVFLFDREFFYPNWELIIDDISARKPSNIYRIHPIVCHTLTEFFEARKKTKLARDIEYILDLNVPTNEINYMMNHYKKYFLADISMNSNIYLPLKSNLPTNNPYYRNIIYTLNLLYTFWAHNIPIKVRVEDTPIGVTNNPIKELQQAIATWTTGTTKMKRTMRERINRNKIMISQYEEIIKNYPNAKTLFDQSYEELVQRGFWNI